VHTHTHTHTHTYTHTHTHTHTHTYIHTCTHRWEELESYLGDEAAPVREFRRLKWEMIVLKKAVGECIWLAMSLSRSFVPLGVAGRLSACTGN